MTDPTAIALRSWPGNQQPMPGHSQKRRISVQISSHTCTSSVIDFRSESTTEVSRGRWNVRFWVLSGSRFRPTGGPFIAKSGSRGSVKRHLTLAFCNAGIGSCLPGISLVNSWDLSGARARWRARAGRRVGRGFWPRPSRRWSWRGSRRNSSSRRRYVFSVGLVSVSALRTFVQ
jgi:hypothetical protein